MVECKFDKAKIYKIVDNTNNNIYIGSTCKSLNTRLSEHKSDYKRFLKGIYNNVTSFDILKNNDYQIELLEDCNIKTKQELIAKERYYIENNNCLNKYIPGRSKKEYNDINREKIANCQKEYKDTNKNKIDNYQREYKEINKEKNANYQKEYRDINKEKLIIQKKEYYKENKEKLNELNRIYRENNKNKLSIKASEKFKCECGGKFTHVHKARHMRSQKHQNYLELI